MAKKCLSSVWKQKSFAKDRSDLSKNFNYFWKKPDLLLEKEPLFTSVWRHEINPPEKDFEPATFGVLAVMTASTFVWYKIPDTNGFARQHLKSARPKKSQEKEKELQPLNLVFSSR